MRYLLLKIIYSQKWNFDLEEPIGYYQDYNKIKRGASFFKSSYHIKNDLQNSAKGLLERLQHTIKKRFSDKLIEDFIYHYSSDRLVKRECKAKSGKLLWYIEYLYNEKDELHRCDTYTYHQKGFSLINYSLFYYDPNGNKNLRKILSSGGSLNCYEVFHYNEEGQLHKKEMFGKENEKIFSEIYQYDKENNLYQIAQFDAEDHFEQSISIKEG